MTIFTRRFLSAFACVLGACLAFVVLLYAWNVWWVRIVLIVAFLGFGYWSWWRGWRGMREERALRRRRWGLRR